MVVPFSGVQLKWIVTSCIIDLWMICTQIGRWFWIWSSRARTRASGPSMVRAGWACARSLCYGGCRWDPLYWCMLRFQTQFLRIEVKLFRLMALVLRIYLTNWDRPKNLGPCRSNLLRHSMSCSDEGRQSLSWLYRKYSLLHLRSPHCLTASARYWKDRCAVVVRSGCI